MIVGRRAELERLDHLLSTSAPARGGRLLVAGEPGTGVSSLLGVLARRAAARGFRVIRASGVEGAHELPSSLVADLLRRLPTDAAEPSGSVLRPARGARTGPGPAADLLEALGAAAGRGAVLVVLDDAQRADPESMAALACATERLADLPLVVAVGVCSAPLAIPPRLAGWDRLELGPLSDDAAQAVLRSVGVTEASVREHLVAAAHGNPLALHEIPTLLGAEVIAGRAPLPEVLPVPETLRRAWSTASQGAAVRSSLLCAALCEPNPPGAGPAALTTTAAQEIARAGVVVESPVGTLGWGSPWQRAVVLAESGVEQRRRAHRRLACEARARGLSPSGVVHHLELSVGGRDAAVADLLAQEAERAEALGLVDIAPRAWAASARVSEDPAARQSRALRGADLVLRSGFGAAVLDDLVAVLSERPLPAGDEPLHRALLGLQRVSMDPAVGATAIRSAIRDAAVSMPGQVPGLLWELAATCWAQGDVEAGLDAARRYVELEQAGAPGTGLAWTGTALLAAGLFQAGRVAESEPLRAEAMRRADGLDPVTAAPRDLVDAVAIDDLLLDLRPEATERLLVAAQRLAAEPVPLACLWGIRAWRARARGDLTTAARLLEQGRPLAESMSVDGAVCGMTALAVELAALTGDDDALRRESEALRRLTSALGDRRRHATLDRALGVRSLAAGRCAEALPFLAAAADCAFLGRGLRDGVLPARVDLVEALVRTEDRAAAEQRAATVLPVLEAMQDPLAAALAARVRGLLAGDVDSALACFDVAIRHHRQASDDIEHGRTLLLRGEMLRRARRRGDARADLLLAEKLFDDAGARSWSARAESELRAAGGRLDPEPTARDHGLTPQEHAVARAVASGGSNREVAEALFLSPRTVEYHLGNVYRKLGVRSRAALAARLHLAAALDLRGAPADADAPVTT